MASGRRGSAADRSWFARPGVLTKELDSLEGDGVWRGLDVAPDGGCRTQVTQRESDTAVEIARTTGGVQKVVRVFEIISEEAARKLDNPPVNNAPAEQPAAAKK